MNLNLNTSAILFTKSTKNISTLFERCIFISLNTSDWGSCIGFRGNNGEVVQNKLCYEKCSAMKWGQTCRIEASTDPNAKNFFLMSSMINCGMNNVGSHMSSMLYGSLAISYLNSTDNSCSDQAGYFLGACDAQSYVNFSKIMRNSNPSYGIAGNSGLSNLYMNFVDIVSNPVVGLGLILNSKVNSNIENCNIYNNGGTTSVYIQSDGITVVKNSYVNPKTANSDKVIFESVLTEESLYFLTIQRECDFIDIEITDIERDHSLDILFAPFIVISIID